MCRQQRPKLGCIALTCWLFRQQSHDWLGSCKPSGAQAEATNEACVCNFEFDIRLLKHHHLTCKKLCSFESYSEEAPRPNSFQLKGVFRCSQPFERLRVSEIATVLMIKPQKITMIIHFHMIAENSLSTRHFIDPLICSAFKPITSSGY